MSSIDKNLHKELIEKYDEKKNSFYVNSISNNDIHDVFLNRKYVKGWDNTFTKIIQPNVKVTNQKHSGLCWLFTFTNMLRIKLIDQMNLGNNFQLSQNYLHFYDKLEKCYYFLNLIFKYKNRDVSDRIISYLLKKPISDGGFWNMACNLVNKYGIVPLSNMRGTFQSSKTKKLNSVLNLLMRRYAYIIRNKSHTESEFKAFLKKKMHKIYRILVYFLGNPPQTFDWKYYIKSSINGDKERKVIKNLTPLNFLKDYIHFNSSEYHILVNLPLKNYPFNHNYYFKYCNNMLDGDKAVITNIDIDKFINIVKKSIDKNDPVWIGSDVEKYFYKKKGIANTDIYDYELLHDDNEELSKGTKILFKQSKPTHAMLIQGYNLDKNGEIDRFLIQNSWGKKVNKGFVNMSVSWFKKYCYDIVVKYEYLDETTQKAVKKGDPRSILPWELFQC